jgi:hypothetical protein
MAGAGSRTWLWPGGKEVVIRVRMGWTGQARVEPFRGSHNRQERLADPHVRRCFDSVLDGSREYQGRGFMADNRTGSVVLLNKPPED